MTRGLKIFLAVVLLTVAAATLGLLHWQNGRIRGRIAEMRRRSGSAEGVRQENAALRDLLARLKTGKVGADQAIQGDLIRMRREVADLEKRAAEQYARRADQAAAFARALETNRDPSKGLTRLEYFQNLGQSTPSTAFQTVAWAALKGDDGALAKGLTLSEAARSRAEALIASLPESTRAPLTPDKIAALAVTGLFSEMPAAQVVGETLSDPQHATLVVSVPGQATNAKIPLQLGASGWQVVVGEGQIKVLEQRIKGESGTPPKK